MLRVFQASLVSKDTTTNKNKKDANWTSSQRNNPEIKNTLIFLKKNQILKDQYTKQNETKKFKNIIRRLHGNPKFSIIWRVPRREEK